MSRICLQGFVSGKVQGVWFRGSTQQQARSLGVTGWARNLEDGRVEVLLCGEVSSVRELATWLHQGPPAARVSDVALDEVSWQEISGFATG